MKLFTPARSRKGFTLIELMLVMVILGILVTMISGNFVTSLKRGRDSKRKQDLSQVVKALETYYNDAGRYPTDNGGVIVGCGTIATPTDCLWGHEFSVSAGGKTVYYMVQLPEDPRSAQRYYYDAGTDANGRSYFQLYTNLENDDDDAVNRNAGNEVQRYDGTDCGTVECNYGVASSNQLPTLNHPLDPP